MSILSACKKDPNPQPIPAETRADLLLGTWKSTFGGPHPDSLEAIDERYGYVETYRKGGTGNSLFLADSTEEAFDWIVSTDESYIRQIRAYDGAPDTMYLELYSFEKDKFIFKDTSFGMVFYGVFERQ